MFIVGYKLEEPASNTSFVLLATRGYQGALNYGQNGLLLLQHPTNCVAINDSLGFKTTTVGHKSAPDWLL